MWISLENRDLFETLHKWFEINSETLLGKDIHSVISIISIFNYMAADEAILANAYT